MSWPPSTHGDVEDAVTAIRDWYAPPTGLWITAPGAATTLAAQTVGTVQYMPLFLPAGTVADLTVRVTTAATASSGATVKLGLYSTAASFDSTLGRVPGTLVVTGTAISTETAGARSLAVNQAVSGGLYWLAAVPLVVSANFNGVGADSLTGRTGITASTGSLASSVVTLQQAGQSTLPSTAAPTAAVSSGIRSWCSFSALD